MPWSKEVVSGVSWFVSSFPFSAAISCSSKLQFASYLLAVVMCSSLNRNESWIPEAFIVSHNGILLFISGSLSGFSSEFKLLLQSTLKLLRFFSLGSLLSFCEFSCLVGDPEELRGCGFSWCGFLLLLLLMSVGNLNISFCSNN